MPGAGEGGMQTHTQLDTEVDQAATAGRGWDTQRTEAGALSPRPGTLAKVAPYQPLALNRAQGNQEPRATCCVPITASEAERACHRHTHAHAHATQLKRALPLHAALHGRHEGVARRGLCPFPGPAASARQGAFLRGSSQGLGRGWRELLKAGLDHPFPDLSRSLTPP